MFNFIRRRLSVKLSLLLSLVVIPSLTVVALMVVDREVVVVESLVLKEAKTAALQGAAAYGLVLDTAVDSGALSLEDVLGPDKEEIHFTDAEGNPLHVEEMRYTNKLSVYVRAHGVQRWEDATKAAGNFIFVSGMDRRGIVPVTNASQDAPPRGDIGPWGWHPADAAWDRIHSRGGRQYTGSEQVAAAGFRGNSNAMTLVQAYPRDTGEEAWDVAAPIFVKGHHFGGFRVGVARDRISQQHHDLTFGLALLFSLMAGTFIGVVFFLVYVHIRPISSLAMHVRQLSMSGDSDDLAVRLVSSDVSEVGEMTRAVNLLRASLYAAMTRIESASYNAPKENKT